MSIIGTRVKRVEDPRFLTAGGTYSDDLRDPRLEGALHLTFVRSTMAHARLRSVDVTAAREAPGVVAVLTAADLGVAPQLAMAMLPATMARPPLADGVVRFVGEPIAAVLTEGRQQGPDAAELVEVDYDPLPVVVDPVEALRDDVVLFPEAGTNLAFGRPVQLDDTFFDGCEVVVSQVLQNRRLAVAPLESRACAAAPGEDGRLVAWLSSQGAQAARDSILAALGLEPGELHVLTPDVGGGFGAKSGAGAEDVVVCRAAQLLGRPVRFVETRTENVQTMHGRAQVQTVTIGGRRDGTVEAYRLEALGDAGAYPAVGAFLPMMTRMMAPGVYRFPKVEVAVRSVVTNTAPVVAYRGAGRPEAAAAVERAIDLFAAEIGMDPVEVRRRNLVPAFDEPFKTAIGTTYDVGDYPDALARVLEAAGYDDLRAEQARRRADGATRQLGIGVSVYVEVTAPGGGGSEVARIEVRPDGGAVVYTGTSPHGQGHATSWLMIASERLGIPMERIDFVYGDTDLVPVGGGTGGSRSLQLGGSAVDQAAGELVEDARRRAAAELEANPDDVVLDLGAGRFHVVGTPSAGRSWAELATAAAGSAEGAAFAGLVVDSEFRAASSTFPFGAHVAVVEVDVETGQVAVERFVAVDDAGRILNPLIVEGQRHGGIAQGIAQALCEEIVYDVDGNPLTANLADFTFISACELPSFELVPMETPTPVNPLGAKGIGESGTIGATPAVQNAVVDALAHLGVRHIDMPTTPQRVWSALQEVR
jgi:carbon-monoxide dehydrogenase large subunit